MAFLLEIRQKKTFVCSRWSSYKNTYLFYDSSSSLLRQVFTKAVSEGRKFRVIIADGRPKFEGKEMARHMINIGLHCTYVLVSSVPYIIQEVVWRIWLAISTTDLNVFDSFRWRRFLLVLMQCSRTAVSCLELEPLKWLWWPSLTTCLSWFAAKRINSPREFKPTHLSSMSLVRVQTLTQYVELLNSFPISGDPDDLVDTGLKVNPLEDWRDLNALTLLNLTYDVTPASLVDAIISEISVIPGTSVPVVLRLKKIEHS